jgi:hypothetical protein
VNAAGQVELVSLASTSFQPSKASITFVPSRLAWVMQWAALV